MVEAYDKVWIVGDRLVQNSAHVFRSFFKTEKDFQGTMSHNSYIAQQYNVSIFTSDHLLNRSVLGRVRNAFITGLNKHDKLPKYVIISMDEDFLRCINF